MKILIIGDVVGNAGLTYLEKNLRRTAETLGADAIIVNGENATEIHGICAEDAQRLLDCGADVITLGNHTYSAKDLGIFLDDNCGRIIRPANFPAELPGVGSTVFDVCGYRVLVMNVCGNVFMEPLDSPFDAVERMLKREAGNYDYSILDLHAEASSEKLAVAKYFDGRIDVVFGTHTHIATADERFLPNGTAYITDIGMTGPIDGILGTDADAVIKRMRLHIPARFTVAEGACASTGILVEIGDKKSLRRIKF